jgi:transmembrane sensor
MNDRNHSLDQEQALAAERAAEWLRQLDQGERNREQFVKWLSRSPENVGEILTAATTDVVLRQLMAEKKFDAEQFVAAASSVPSIGDAPPREPMKHRARLQLMVASVGLSLAAGIAAIFFFAPSLVHDWLHPNEYTTSVGELRTVNLADGSIVAINAQSRVRVALSEHWRDLYLDKGQAIFTVAKDKTRPFRVHVIANGENGELKDTVIQAVGTKFDVRRNDDGVNVAVVEGVVQIESDGLTSTLDESMKKIGEAARRVAAGQSVDIKTTGIVAPTVQINVASVGMWQQRRLVFIDARLEDIVKEFERYNRSPRIRVEGDALKDRRFSGVFDADYPEQQLIGYFSSQEENTVSLNREGDDLIIRLRADADQSREE